MAQASREGDRVPFVMTDSLGVQTRKNRAAVIVAEEGDRQTADSEYHDDVSHADKPKFKPSTCCQGDHQTAPSLRLVYALLTVCLVAVGLLLAAQLCNSHWDRQTRAEIRSLQDEVQRLKASCQQHKQQWVHSTNDDSDGGYPVAGVGDGAAAGLPWRPNAGQTVPGFSVPGLTWKESDRHEWTPHATDGDFNGDDIDDDDDDDDLDEEDDDEADEGDTANIFQRFRRSADTDDEKKKKRKTRRGGACGRVEKCLKEKKNGKKPSKRCKKIMKCPIIDTFSTTPPPTTIPPFVPKAVHFMSNFWGSLRQEKFKKDVCIYIEEWEATACRNRTVRFSQDNKTPIKFLEPADWMRTEYKDESEQPIVSLKDGRYNVTQAGLYLIYSSVMFHDNKPRQSQALVVDDHKLFKCMDSVDYIDLDLPAEANQAKYKSCVMTGVTHLNVGQILQIQNLYDNTEIDLSEDATYFGAVLLSPGRAAAKN